MALPCVIVALCLWLLGPCPVLSAPQGSPEPEEQPYDLEDFDLNGETDWENLDLNGESYDYDDLDQEIEVGTVASPTSEIPPPANVSLPREEEEVTLAPKPTPPPATITLNFKAPGLFGPETGMGMPTCLLCVCISGSVYCDEADLDQIPPLPKETTHFYGRFNRIRHVKNTDFSHLSKLKRIDLTGNQLSGLDEDAFGPLPQLQDILLADNNLQALPELPSTVRYIDVRNNRLISNGIHRDAFKEMSQLEFLYLSDNKLSYVPVPLPERLRVLHLQNNNIQTLNLDTFCNSHDRHYIRGSLEDIRLDGNPVNLNLYASSYTCLHRLPIGSH